MHYTVGLNNNVRNLPSISWDSLFFAMPVEETGPLEAGLFTADPKHWGDAHHQHHQVLDEEQGDIWPACLFHLWTFIFTHLLSMQHKNRRNLICNQNILPLRISVFAHNLMQCVCVSVFLDVSLALGCACAIVWMGSALSQLTAQLPKA